MNNVLFAKKNNALTIISLLLLIFATLFVRQSLAVETTIGVDPPTITQDIGGTFEVNITITQVTYVDIISWSLLLNWNPALLNVTSVEEGPFLSSVAPEGTFFIKKIYQEQGYVDLACSILGDYHGPSGNGTLATLAFQVERSGETDLDLNTTKLLDYYVEEIPHTVQDGYFYLLPPMIYVDPERSTAKPASPVTVNITIDRITDLYRWEFMLSWNATLLQATTVAEGPFLASGGPTTFYFATDTFQNETGSYERVYANCTLLGSVPGVDGNGAIATITFSVQTTGTAVLDLNGTKLLTSSLTEIAHETVDGEFSNKLPVASFRYDPQEPIINHNVTFQSTSQDPDGHITAYTWNFGDTAENFTITQLTIQHNYTSTGTFNVMLTVTDNDGYNDTATRIINIKTQSTITISASPATVTYGEDITITGTITPTRDGADVIIQYKPPPPVIIWSNLTTVQTNATSQYTYTWRPQKAVTYSFRALWSGDATAASSQSSVASVTVNKAGSSITISASPATVTYGEDITITGTITPTQVQASVTLWYRTSGTEAFNNLTTVLTDNNSVYSYQWTTSATGTYEIKANWTGDANTLPAESTSQSITINRATSTITIGLNATAADPQSIVLVNGSISPKRAGVTVTISYLQPGGFKYIVLSTTTTDSNGGYSYLWTLPDAPGKYQIKANWDGDANTLGSESAVEAVTINAPAAVQDILPYVIAGAIIVIVVLAVLFLIMRRRRARLSQEP